MTLQFSDGAYNHGVCPEDGVGPYTETAREHPDERWQNPAFNHMG